MKNQFTSMPYKLVAAGRYPDYSILLKTGPNFYKRFGITVSQFNSMPHRDKLMHLFKVKNQLGSMMEVRKGIRMPLESALNRMPLVDYAMQPTKDGILCDFFLSEARNLLRADTSTGKGAGAVSYCPATGRFLIARRSNDSDAPGSWANLGGGVDPGETIMQGLRRELIEEGQLHNPGTFHPVCKIGDDKFMYYNFVCETDTEHQPVLNDEHTNFLWLTLSELLEMNLHPKFREALEHPRFLEIINEINSRQ